MSTDKAEKLLALDSRFGTQRLWVDGKLTGLQGERFYGTMILKMEGGIIKRMELTTTELPPGATPTT